MRPVLHLETSLGRELYYHGEPLSVNVHVTNISTKTYANICLLSTVQYNWPVGQIKRNDQVSMVLPLDGTLKHKDTNLASSTIMKESADKEVLGILLPFVLMHPKSHHHITFLGPQIATPETDAPGDTSYTTDDDSMFKDFAQLAL
ncbi:unnamed protein product [Nyctereutes procyonoides]|uniref:Beta-arrestin-2 n=1 Tax=Nyctereutes procyonoides TaxID=34880 RepID=A0A811YE79_NYCPR|nr:unnamed protein product [Nyctereutes procyonoides]